VPPGRGRAIFQSHRFRQACGDYWLGFTTPYTPEQSGLIERFLRNLREGWTWQTNFQSFLEAKRVMGRWIENDNWSAKDRTKVENSGALECWEIQFPEQR
jgi:hypothetical protein